MPRKLLESGITMCLERVIEYLSDASSLLQAQQQSGTLKNATILATFGIEELGKAIILRESLQRQPGVETVKVSSSIFVGKKAHDTKQEAAFRLMGSGSRKVHVAAFNSDFGDDFDIKDT